MTKPHAQRPTTSRNKTLYIKSAEDYQIWDEAKRFIERYERISLSEFVTNRLREAVEHYRNLPETSLIEASREILAYIENEPRNESDPLASACRKLKIAIANEEAKP